MRNKSIHIRAGLQGCKQLYRVEPPNCEAQNIFLICIIYGKFLYKIITRKHIRSIEMA